MPLNTTETELRRNAAKDLAKKLKLERRSIIEFRALFRQMGKDLAAFVSRTGNTPNANVYRDDVRGLVSKQYRRTSQAFIGSVTKFLQKNKNNLDEETIARLNEIAISLGISLDLVIDDLISDIQIQLQARIAQAVTEDTNHIIETTQKEFDTSVALAQASLEERSHDDRETKQDPPTRVEIALVAARTFVNRSVKRANTIAATITQKAAEGTKFLERDVFFRLLNAPSETPLAAPRVEEQEVWVTVGDDRVRESHLIADLSQKENGIFTVQGQSLKFPGDTSLGATADNVINCRCSAQAVFE